MKLLTTGGPDCWLEVFVTSSIVPWKRGGLPYAVDKALVYCSVVYGSWAGPKPVRFVPGTMREQLQRLHEQRGSTTQ
ncbi:MAG TPA: hypothetical protein VKD65_17000 [Candidatus Angelobacter sp.]|nr:hypothetical protein [Candidatus Angelobacter sp.]